MDSDPLTIKKNNRPEYLHVNAPKSNPFPTELQDPNPILRTRSKNTTSMLLLNRELNLTLLHIKNIKMVKIKK